MEQKKIENWKQEIMDLENFFLGINELPVEPIKLDKCNKIIDISLFIESHLSIIKAHNGEQIYLPYLNRLQKFKEILTIYFAFKLC